MNLFTQADIIPLGFLVIGGFFVYSLLMAIFKLLSFNLPPNGNYGKEMFKIFRTTIFSFIALMIFVLFILPILQK